ncbi:hypothetical protein ACVWWQ_001059 [Rhodanobacter sp. TND4EL1]
MSDVFNLLFLLGLVAVVTSWLKLSAARERAVLEARRQCQQHGLQLLDETVGLRALRLRRHNGLRRIERCYGFEVSVDGHDRESCRLWVLGNTVIGVSLPVIASLPHEETASRTLTSVQVDNVVPLRPRSNNRLN